MEVRRLMGEGSITGVGLRRRGRVRPGGWQRLDPLLHRELRAGWVSGAMHGMVRSSSSSLIKSSMCSAWCGRWRCGNDGCTRCSTSRELSSCYNWWPQIVHRNSPLGKHLGGGYIDFPIMSSLSLCASLHVQHDHGQIDD